MEVEAQASCRALGRQVETYIRRMGQPRVAALDATTAILICQWRGEASARRCKTTVWQQQIRQERGEGLE